MYDLKQDLDVRHRFVRERSYITYQLTYTYSNVLFQKGRLQGSTWLGITTIKCIGPEIRHSIWPRNTTRRCIWNKIYDVAHDPEIRHTEVRKRRLTTWRVTLTYENEMKVDIQHGICPEIPRINVLKSRYTLKHVTPKYEDDNVQERRHTTWYVT